MGSSRLLGTAGPAFYILSKNVFLHGVAPDRVYSGPLLPGGRVRSYRTFPPLLRREAAQRYISVALVRGSPLAGVTRYPCPVEPGLSSRTAFRLVPAVVRPARKGILIENGGEVNKNIVFGPVSAYSM